MLIKPAYSNNIVRSYKYWHLLVSDKQRYLGRSYIWWRDRKPGEGENMAYDDLPDDALLETKRIWRDVVRCCRTLGYTTEPYGQDFRLNTAYLANESQHHRGHMHIHFIPRTSSNFLSQPIGVETMDAGFKSMYVSGGEDRLLDTVQMEALRRLFGIYAIA